jgi:hypothetical protein
MRKTHAPITDEETYIALRRVITEAMENGKVTILIVIEESAALIKAMNKLM